MKTHEFESVLKSRPHDSKATVPLPIYYIPSHHAARAPSAPRPHPPPPPPPPPRLASPASPARFHAAPACCPAAYFTPDGPASPTAGASFSSQTPRTNTSDHACAGGAACFRPAVCSAYCLRVRGGTRCCPASLPRTMRARARAGSLGGATGLCLLRGVHRGSCMCVRPCWLGVNRCWGAGGPRGCGTCLVRRGAGARAPAGPHWGRRAAGVGLGGVPRTQTHGFS